ncbi:MAG: T9SS type A sorting domain-containing protein [Weeksellaceae bacterium]|nr:T9SS type A sorting domain-containing protein [Weeksellaceae bacterium]
MKTLFTYLILGLCCLQAQDFFHADNHWIYRAVSQDHHAYVHHTWDGTAQINGETYHKMKRVLKRYDSANANEEIWLSHTETLTEIYFREVDGMLRFYDPHFQMEKNAYPLQAHEGYSWETGNNSFFGCVNVQVAPDEEFEVLSTGNMSIGEHMLQIMNIIEGENYIIGNRIYNQIGASSSFLPMTSDMSVFEENQILMERLQCFRNESTGMDINFYEFDLLGCTALLSTQNLGDAVSQNLKKQFMAYPNPATNYFMIKDGDGVVMIEKILIYDASGALMSQTEYVSGKGYNVEILTPGTYYVLFSDENQQRAMLKFIKK